MWCDINFVKEEKAKSFYFILFFSFIVLSYFFVCVPVSIYVCVFVYLIFFNNRHHWTIDLCVDKMKKRICACIYLFLYFSFSSIWLPTSSFLFYYALFPLYRIVSHWIIIYHKFLCKTFISHTHEGKEEKKNREIWMILTESHLFLISCSCNVVHYFVGNQGH